MCEDIHMKQIFFWGILVGGGVNELAAYFKLKQEGRKLTTLTTSNKNKKITTWTKKVRQTSNWSKTLYKHIEL